MAKKEERAATDANYVVQQAGFLLIELHKMLIEPRHSLKAEKARKAASAAARRAAKALDDLAPPR